uniref:Reverse transcriptase domain-containing protein n=1 Tax=Haemonchus contortus TaxID=6289 RepID=A0A7I4XRA8_HAECO
MRNGTAPGPDRIKAEHLKSLPTVIVKTLARLFTRYLSQCKVPISWKTSKTVLLYKKIGGILDEGQPCEQAGFRKGFSAINHIHTVTRLIEVSREYKMPLCLTFIDLKKAFDTVETEAVIEALGKLGVPAQYIRMLRELYDSYTTRISPFYKEVIINVKGGVRQGDTISPKFFCVAFENVMRHMEWESMGVKVIRSSELRRRTKIRNAVGYAKRSKIRWAGHVMRCDIMMTVGPGRLRTGSLGTSCKHQDGRQRDGQTSSRKL